MIHLNGFKIEQGKFPDGTLLMKFDREFDFNNVIMWKYESDAEMFAVMCLVNHIRDHKEDAYIELVLPYVPNARQDRVKSDEDIFTLKYFCQFINSLKFNKVRVQDVHSNVSLALLDRVHDYGINYPLHKALTKIVFAETNDVMHESREECYKNLVVFFPDEGAMKRYSSAVTEFPIAFGIKNRDWKTGQIKGLDLMNGEAVKGKNVLIIDDICSRGGTFYHSAKALKEAGAANIYLYVTHCENTIHEGELLNSDLIKHIYTTDSILTKDHKKITVIE